ncbi:acyl carrier protein [Paenibacillus tritici]|uniref:Acyl carrier protein n=2 Tax=Paenibacillus tritici TaxID=1873425 RepID=A0ABX2DSW0_9BACL|nr:acyl carrier protein [Paenibacillus tritici]QUL58255.1 acyl carrier protein [Paenibacillus tritici]
MTSYEETISSFILKHINQSELDYDLRIFEEGLVNSLFAIELMTFLEKSFKIKIRIVDLDMEHFQSVHSIAAFVNNKQAEVHHA